MTDLNPSPNDRLVIRGILGFGDVFAGIVLILIGFLKDITPLLYVGLGLLLCGVALTILTSRQNHRPSSPDQTE